MKRIFLLLLVYLIISAMALMFAAVADRQAGVSVVGIVFTLGAVFTVIAAAVAGFSAFAAAVDRIDKF